MHVINIKGERIFRGSSDVYTFCDTILFNDQLDARFFFVYVYFISLHVSSIQVLIIRRLNCINTISGVCLSM